MSENELTNQEIVDILTGIGLMKERLDYSLVVAGNVFLDMASDELSPEYIKFRAYVDKRQKDLYATYSKVTKVMVRGYENVS